MSGYGTNLLISGSPSVIWQAGKLGNSLLYDITSPVNCTSGPSIQSANVPTALQTLPSASFSTSFWVNNIRGTTLFHFDTTLCAPGFCGFFTSPYVVRAAMSGSAYNNFSISTSAYAGGWHLFAYVFDLTAKTHSFYVDGNILGSGSLSGTSYGTIRQIGIGSYLPSCVDTAAGAVFDDVRIYNRALSAEEIFALYNANK